MKPEKTLKREVAVVLLLWLAYVVEVKDESLVEILVWPVFSFAAAAFGFDQYAKLQQGKSSRSSYGRWSQRSSQYPGREDQHTDGGDYK